MYFILTTPHLVDVDLVYLDTYQYYQVIIIAVLIILFIYCNLIPDFLLFPLFQLYIIIQNLPLDPHFFSCYALVIFDLSLLLLSWHTQFNLISHSFFPFFSLFHFDISIIFTYTKHLFFVIALFLPLFPSPYFFWNFQCIQKPNHGRKKRLQAISEAEKKSESRKPFFFFLKAFDPLIALKKTWNLPLPHANSALYIQ